MVSWVIRKGTFNADKFVITFIYSPFIIRKSMPPISACVGCIEKQTAVK